MKFYCSLVFLAMASCVALDAQLTTTATQKVTTVAKNGTRSVHTREIQISSKRTPTAVKPLKISETHGTPTLSNAIPAAKNAGAGHGKLHANLLPGYPNATTNSQNFGTTAVGGTSATITLSYPYPSGVTSQELTFAAGLNGFFGQATCNYPQPCTAPIAFQPVYPGLTTNAVISKDQNGNIIYETFLYATGTAPQFGFDLGDLTEYDGVTNQPDSVAVGPDGNIYVADASQNSVYKIAADFSSQEKLNIVELGVPGGIAVDGASTIYIADKTNNVIVAYNEANGAQTTVTTSALSNPGGVAVDGTGALYIADTGHNRIIVIDNQGNETTLINDISAPTSLAVDGAGDVFYADANNGGEITELPANGSSIAVGTQLGTLYDMAVDAARRVYVSTSTGVTLIASDGSSEGFGGLPNYGMAVDPAGDVITTQPGNSSVSVTDRSASNFAVYAQVNTTTRAADAISNTGTDPLTLSNITISGTVFTSDPNTGCTVGLTLQPGDVCHLVVDFTPPAAQSYQESYTVTSNSLNVSTTMDVDTLYGNGSGVETTTGLSIAPNPATTGQSVTFTATVASSSPGTVAAPTGLVYFQDGTTTLGSTSITSGGTAQFSTSSLAAGMHSITAEYGGDSLNSPSVSAAQNEVVNAGAALGTNTLLVVTPAAPAAGQAVTFSVSVTGSTQSSPVPTGTVTVTNNNVTPAVTLGTVTLSGGSGTFTTSSLTTGSYSVTGTYNGDTTYAASTSGADTFTVSPPPATTTTLIASPATVAYEKPVTLTASVATAAGMAVTKGQVIFCDAAATYCNLNSNLGIAQLNAQGSAVLRLSPGTIGGHSYKAVFAGTNADVTSSSANQTVTVTGTYPTTTTIAATGSAGSYSLTGTVVGLGALSASPTGVVSFVDTSNSNAALGTATLGAGTAAFGEAQSAGSPLAVGQVPYDVAKGDFNGDGLLDLAVANGGGSTVSVLLGNGDGTFQAQVTYPAGTIPTHIAVADVNGDGISDLIVTDDGGSTGAVDVLLGNGDGTFQAMVSYPCPFPEGLALLDVNHDGIPDIVAAGNPVSVLIGNGDGSFQAAVAYTVGNFAQYVTEADFNGDGNIDIAVSNGGDGTVSVLLGNGDGTFQTQVTYAVGAEPQGIQAADLNGDGFVDLAVANSTDNTVSVLLGKGDGSFRAQVTYPAGMAPVALAIADFNGDGFPDLTVSNFSGETESVLLGKGDGTFGAQSTYATGESPQAVATGDFNGDGLPDMAVANNDANTLTVLLSQVTQTAVTPATNVTIAGAATTHDVESNYPGDTNFTASMSQTTPLMGGGSAALSGTTLLVSMPAAPTVGQAVTFQVSVSGNTQTSPVPTGTVTVTNNSVTPAVTLGTITLSGGSGRFTTSSLTQGTYAVTAMYSGDTIYAASTSGADMFTVSPGSTTSATTTTLELSASTVAYGKPVTLSADVSTASGSVVSVGQVAFCDAAATVCNALMNLGVGQLGSEEPAVFHLPGGTIGAHQYIAKFLGTSTDQTSSSGSQTLTVTGTYPTTTTISSTGTGGTYNLTGTVVGLGTNAVSPSGTVSFLDTSNANASLGTAPVGAGTLGFALVQPAGSPDAVGSGAYGVATGDFNGDGFLDMVVENYSAGTVSVLLGNGDGTFKPQVTYPVGSLPERVLVADLNGDGSLDIIVANSGSGTIGVLLGNGDGTFQAQVTYASNGTPVGLGVMDINHDGIPDVVAGDYYENKMAVLLGNGDGTLQAAVTYTTGSTPQTVAEGDFNGDGNVDVVVGNEGGATVGIFLGNGDGTFQAMVTYAVGNSPQGVQVGDFNDDGKEDLAVTNNGDGTVSVLLGNGDGTFQTQVTYPVGGQPIPLAIADFNGDGIQDITVGNTVASNRTQGVLLGNGDGTFKPQVTFPTGNFPYGIATGDFNGDGLPDIAVGTFNDATATIFLSQVTQTATANMSVTVGGSATTTHSVEASYPGDTNFSASVSLPTTLSGGGSTTTAASMTTLTVTPTTVTVGQSVAFTSSVFGTTQTTPVPTGTVMLTNAGMAGPAVLGTITLGTTGSGTFSTSTLTAGTYLVTAVYGGDTNYSASTSAPVTLTVSGVPSAPMLTSISPAGGVTGSPATTVTLTGTNFTAADQVLLGQAALTTTFVNTTTLTAVVPASFFGEAGTYPVSVTYATGSLTSLALNFVVSVAPVVVFTGPSTATSDQQPVVTFQLVQPYAVPIDSLLTLTFVPSTAAGIVDPNVQFSSGGTTINAVIPASSTTTPPVEFQTGTVAGTATVTLTITDANGDPLTPLNVAPVVVTLPATVPQITSTTATRATGVFTVTMQGYSNTREVKTAIFHFTPMPGATLDNPDVTVDVSGIFAQWFGMEASDAFGSSFTYTQPFNLTADPATIQSVTVTLVNTVGSSTMQDAQ